VPADSLAALIPTGAPSADDILTRFVGWVEANGLSLYPAQEEAILELLGGKHLVLGTPTGSGKSLVATALHFKAMAEGKVSFYTCPIKALVSEKFFALCQAFGADSVGMLTGDASINRDAPIICCTAEILANLALRDARPRVDYVVMDEFHYYADKERGVAWQLPLIALRDVTFLLMSATLGDTRPIRASLAEFTGREVAEVASSARPVPLDFTYAETPLHETIEKLVAARKIPVYVVNFTQRAAAEQAQNLLSVDFCTKEEKAAIKDALDGVPFDTPYGKDFQRYLRHGIGLHHAGLLPKYRLLVEKLAQAGLLKIISGTDTLGVGVNIPIRTVLFTQLCKYDGEKDGILRARDFHQIAGRAGRKGFDDHGSVVVQAPEHVIENLKLVEKAKGKKVVRRQPPQKGYVHWDRGTFDRLLAAQPEPLESRFMVTHGMLLHLLQSSDNGYRRLVELVGRSHDSERARRRHLRTGKECMKTLRHAALVELVRRPGGRGSLVRVSGELQRDFSLNQTLALYLVDTLERLDPASESYALDVLTLVESIVENPMVVLLAQLSRLKTEKLDQLKAEGVEYEQRMEELDKLEWPKPNREFIYSTFNAFAEKHPWVGEENIRPKSIAREMYEHFCSFDDYIRDYGLQRSEGVLLRYLSEVYKTLTQSVPESFRSDEVEDVVAHLGALVRQTDASLLDEWESLRTGAEAPAPAPAQAGRPIVDDPRAFAARVRSELHRVVKALADKDYARAAQLFAPAEPPATAARLEAELGPYWAEHAAIVTTPVARRPSYTLLKQLAPQKWQAQQRLLDPEGDEDWMIECEVELSGPPVGGAPLIALRRIGV
jgi:superfamily II RNA helicase